MNRTLVTKKHYMNFKLKDGKLVGVPDESLTPNLDNYQNEADYLSDLNKHMEYCRIYGEFENLRVGGVLPAPGKFHTELFPSEKKAGGHVYGTYEDYIEYYNKYASLPAYSLSPEMKEWAKSNPKDSYSESDFVVKEMWMVKTSSYQGESEHWFETEKEANEKYLEWSKWNGNCNAETLAPKWFKEVAVPIKPVAQNDKFFVVEYAGFFTIKTEPFYDAGKEIMNAEDVGYDEAKKNAELIVKLLNEYYAK